MASPLDGPQTPVEQREIHCCECDGANSPKARFCSACGADLLSDAQRRFNLVFHAPATAGRPPRPTRPAPPRTGEEDRQRRVEDLRRREQSHRSRFGSPAFLLLQRIENRAVRTLVIFAAIGLPVGLIALSQFGSNAQLIGIAMIGGLASAMMPGATLGSWRRRPAPPDPGRKR